jgi:hypothetical protein
MENSMEAPQKTKNRWIDKKICYLYSMKFYSVAEKNEILSISGKCM